MSKSVRLDEDVYEFVSARKRDDETFFETIEQLVGGPSLLELTGILTDEEASAFEEPHRQKPRRTRPRDRTIARRGRVR